LDIIARPLFLPIPDNAIVIPRPLKPISHSKREERQHPDGRQTRTSNGKEKLVKEKRKEERKRKSFITFGCCTDHAPLLVIVSQFPPFQWAGGRMDMDQ
jgi:hypothetical protein